jgi:hypothetical protein
VPTAPAVTAGEATAISPTGATVPATVDARGDATSFRVDYGRTSAYGASVDGGPVGSGTLPKDVRAALTGLAPATTYHYRVVASSPTGTGGMADDHAFTTGAAVARAPLPAPPPLVTPAKAAKVTVTLASNTRCLSTRTQSVRVKIAAGGTVTAIEVYVGDKRALRVTKAKDLSKTIKVARLPRGSYTLQVRVKTKDGRTVKSSRKFRTCSSSR